MSIGLILSTGDEIGKSQQSPADDIESFFQVTIWAIFHNFYTVEGTLSNCEKTIKTLLRAKTG